MAGTALLGAADSAAQISEATEAGYAAAGSWYQPFTIFTTVVQTAPQLAVVVLLALPASHPFFRKAAPGPVLPPQAYR